MTYVPEPWLESFVVESNRIEGIHGHPESAGLTAHQKLLERAYVDLGFLADFTLIVAGPHARLRTSLGMDVQVGHHIAPPGGHKIALALEALLHASADPCADPYHVHRAYENLHPFMDGNGRSGRALWLWMMERRAHKPHRERGFLHSWYYQSLDEQR